MRGGCCWAFIFVVPDVDGGGRATRVVEGVTLPFPVVILPIPVLLGVPVINGNRLFDCVN